MKIQYLVPLIAAVLVLSLASVTTAQTQANPDTQRIDFKAGWNMFSTILKYNITEDDLTVFIGEEEVFERGGKIIENTCGDLDVWHYSSSIMKIYAKNLLSDFRIKGMIHSMLATYRPAYWVKTNSDCYIVLEGVKYNLYEEEIITTNLLYEGWNQVGSPYTETTTFSEIPSDCNVTSGPWEWDATAKEYKKATNLEPGKGYWIKVKNTCTFGREAPPIPAPPGG
ncbi:MAG: hypothetical protein ACE5GI_01330 [Candidatus Aminicenantales bacterium]